MKNYYRYTGRYLKKVCSCKILKIMRNTFLILFISVFQAYSLDSYSQNTKLNLNMNQVPLASVLEKIEDSSEYLFLYNAKLVDVKREVSIQAENEEISNVLSTLFLGTGVKFKVIDRRIVLSPGDATSLAGSIQQQLEITGKVTDSSGASLPGVTVVIKGTTQGTITDPDGNYSLPNVPADATLVFSFVGMKTQEISVRGKSSIDIVMQESTIGIEEVVAVGYGTMRKQDVTGAVAVADLETYRGVPANNVLEMVKGNIPGLNVSGTNSAGAVASTTIRGQNSIGASNSPLVVVDGIIYKGSLGDIRSDDIESLTVLKDASAAAVYGSRSANGVILIETKKGKGNLGKPQFNIKLVNGITKQLKPLPVYTDGYLDMVLDVREALGLEADPDKIATYLEPIEEENYLATPDHQLTLPDPQEVGLQDAYIRSADLSIANSSEMSNYFISLGVTDQKGVVLNDNFKQLSARVNHNSYLTDWLNLGILASYSIRDNSGSEPNRGNVSRLSPYASIYDENGIPLQYPQTTTSIANPLWSIATDHTNVSHNLNGALKAQIEIPYVEGLTFTSTFSNNLRWGVSRNFYGENTGAGESNKGRGQRAFNSNHYMLFDNMLNYKRVFAETHKIDFTLLYSKEQTSWESESMQGTNFDNFALGHYKLEDAGIQTISSGGGESGAIGQMARLNYTYDNKYSLTATVRRDGYSAFSVNKKWGVFSSLGANWNISRERFMENVENVNSLALSLSYGSVGNQSISSYQTLAKVSTDKVIFAGSNDYVFTQAISSFALNNLGWETTTGLNGALDFGLFENRISGRLDVYNTKTTNLIFNLAVPGIAGGPSSVKDNIGEIANKGFELTLNTINVKRDDFSWSSNFNFSLNRNKIVTIFGEDNDGDGLEDDLIQSKLFIGESLGTIYDYKVIGMWQQEDVDDGTIMTGMRPGDYKTEDVPDINGEVDGQITSDMDRQILGNTKPNFRWSFTNTVNYKRWSMMVYLYSIWGGNNWYLSGSNTPYFDFGVFRTDINHPIYDYWTPDNTDALFPRLNYSEIKNEAHGVKKYFDRSFIKLQKVSISYDLSDVVKPLGINSLKVSLSGDNLATYAPHWLGLDPETNQGLENDHRPSLRNYSLSVLVNF